MFFQTIEMIAIRAALNALSGLWFWNVSLMDKNNLKLVGDFLATMICGVFTAVI